MTATERFAELRKRELMLFPHIVPTHEEAARLARAASIAQVLEQVEAERQSGREHAPTVELERLLTKLVDKNRRGR